MKQVISNHGAGGIDGMQTDELRDYLEANWPLLKHARRDENVRNSYGSGQVVSTSHVSMARP